MEEETITFELIRQIQREEKNSPKLTKLPPNFFENVARYLEKKRKMVRTAREELEVRNIERMVEDIFSRRERKILNFAFVYLKTKIPPENLTEEEEKFFEKLVELLEKRRKELLRVKEKEEEKEEKIEEGYAKILVKQDLDSFIGIDGKTYGPFRKGEEAIIPIENAEILFKRGVIEIIYPKLS